MEKDRDEYTGEAVVLQIKNETTGAIGCSIGMLFFGIFAIIFSLLMPSKDPSDVFLVVTGMVMCIFCIVVICRLWKSRDNKTVITSKGIEVYTGKEQMERFISWADVELVCYERSLYYGWLMRYRIWLRKSNASAKASADELKRTKSDYAIRISPEQDEKVRKFAPYELFVNGGSYYE